MSSIKENVYFAISSKYKSPLSLNYITLIGQNL